jgi:ABC-type transporter Mla subunit MlaD
MLAYTSGEVVDVALAIFLVLTGVGIAWVSFELGATLQQLSAFIKGTQDEVLPVISKVGTTVDHVNAQMEKLDRITDSAVDAAESADTAVRAVSMAVTRPVQKAAGLAAGLSHGVAELKTTRNWRSAMESAKRAAAERERELAEELREAEQE